MWFLLSLLLQDPAPYKAEIVVVAERGETERTEVAAATSVLDRADIDAIPGDDLGALIARVEGVRVVFEEGGAPMVSSRGFFGGGEVEYVQVLIDGVPVGDAESGLVDWRRIRASDIERIEVLRGPASSLYGDASLGGVISVTTRHGSALSRSLAVAAGSAGAVSLTVNHSAELGAGALGLHGAVSARDGSRDHAAEDNHGADLSYRFPLGEWGAAIAGSYSFRDREDPGPLPLADIRTDRSDPLFRFDFNETSKMRGAASLHGPRLRVNAFAVHRSSEIVRTLLLAAGFGDRTAREIDAQSGGVSILTEQTFRWGRLRAGVDGAADALETRYEMPDTRDLLAKAEGDRRRYALFATQDVHLSDRVRLIGGIRWDEIRDSFSDVVEGKTDSALSPRVGINVQLGEGRALFGSYSRAFKAPTLDQRFDPRPFPDGAGGTFTISNPNLVPQEAKNLEIGVVSERPSLDVQLVAYRMVVDDEIDFDVSTFTYKNIGRSRHAGLEASARFQKASRVEPALWYTWTRTESLTGAYRGNQLKNIPEHIARAEIRTRLARDVVLNAALRWTGEWFLDDANEFRIDPSTVVDVRASKRVSRATVHVDLLNLFDEDYAEVGFTLSDFEGNVVPFAFPGAGVSARVGVTWEF